MDLRRLIATRPLTAASLAVAGGAVFGLGLSLGLGNIMAVTPSPPSPVSPPAATARLAAVSFSDLTGWRDDGLSDLIPAFSRSCARIAKSGDEAVGTGPAARPAADWKAACAKVMVAGDDPAALRQVIENAFVPHRISAPAGEDGTFTGYYEATLNGSLSPTERYKYPLYAPPADLISAAIKDFAPGVSAEGLPATLVGRVDGRRLKPYDVRADIEADAFRDRATPIVWIDDPVAVHILHIQGSGQVILPDKTMIRVGFAAHNGHAFTGLGKIMLDEGVLKPGEASMIGVRDWLHKNPARAAALMNKNARYIFFRRIDGAGPIGAEGVALTRLRSLAVDPRTVPLGAPVWVETKDPDGEAINRLMMAQDVGAAILGAVRGDVFWGAGDAAFDKAARMKSKGRAAVLLPRGRP